MRSPETTIHCPQPTSHPGGPTNESICDVLCNQHNLCPQPDANFPARKTRYIETERERAFPDNNRNYNERISYQRRHSNTDHNLQERHRNYGGVNRHVTDRTHGYSDRGFSDRERNIPNRGRSFSDRYRFSERERMQTDRGNGYPRRNTENHFTSRNNNNNNNGGGFPERERDFVERDGRYFESYGRRHYSDDNGRARRIDFEMDVPNRPSRDVFDPRRKRSFREGDRPNALKYRLKSRSRNR